MSSETSQVNRVVDCPDCSGTVSISAVTCPHCGAPNTSFTSNSDESATSQKSGKGRIIALVLAAVALVIGGLVLYANHEANQVIERSREAGRNIGSNSDVLCQYAKENGLETRAMKQGRSNC